MWTNRFSAEFEANYEKARQTSERFEDVFRNIEDIICRDPFRGVLVDEQLPNTYVIVSDTEPGLADVPVIGIVYTFDPSNTQQPIDLLDITIFFITC